MIDLLVLAGETGSVVTLKAGDPVPFDIRRVYYIFGTKPGVSRGFHAHRDLRQWAIALAGSCTMLLDDGKQQARVVLDRPDKALEFGPMIWREIHDLSPDAVLMVLAAQPYDEADYIRRYEDFRAILEESE
jgi:dTDP-4-dehydrorhamnose 3,5-epimerase-like enzyme